DERFGHSQVERKLYETKAVIVASDFARKLYHTRQRMIALFIHPYTKTIPSGRAVHPYLSFSTVFFQKLKCRAQSSFKLFARNFAKLRFGVVNVVNVNAIQPHVTQSPINLALLVAWRHRVAF